MIESIWLLAIATIPIFFNPFSVSNFEPDKAALLKAFALLLLSAWSLKKLFHVIALKSQGNERISTCSSGAEVSKPNWHYEALLGAAFVYICSYVVSSLSSVSISLSFNGSFERQFGLISMLAAFVFFIVPAVHLRKAEQIERIIDALLLGSIPVSIYAIFQRLGIDPLPWGDLVQGRASSTLGNPIFLGAYLVMVFPFALLRLLSLFQFNSAIRAAAQNKHTAGIIFYITLLALQSGALCCSGSRGPLLGWMAGLFVFCFCFLWRFYSSLFRALSFSLLAMLIVAPLMLYFSNSITQAHESSASNKGVENSHPCDFFTYSKLGVGPVEPTPRVVSSPYADTSGYVDAIPACAQRLHGLRQEVLERIRQEFCEKALQKKDSVLIGTIGSSAVLDLACKPSAINLQEDIVARQGTVRVRELLWEAAYKMLRSGAQLVDSNSTPDRLSFLRPFIGYGPDTLGLVISQFYPAEMSNLERNKFLDRMHNQTWQVWIDQGFFGLCAYFLLLFTFFFVALRLITERAVSPAVLFICSFSGAVLAALLAASLKGPGYLGIGLSSGFLSAFFCAFFFFGKAESHAPKKETELKDEIQNNLGVESKTYFTYRAALAIALLSAMLGHFVELQFGMLILPSLLIFWVLIALLVALNGIEVSSASGATISGPQIRWVIYWGFFLALTLSTVSFCMIATPPSEGLNWKALAEFVLSGPGWIILMSSILGSCLLWFNKARHVNLVTLIVALIISLLPALIVALSEMKALLASSSFMAHSLLEVQSNVWSIAILPVRFVILLLSAAIGLGLLALFDSQKASLCLREGEALKYPKRLPLWQMRLWQGVAVLCVSCVALSALSLFCFKPLEAASFAKSARAFAEKGKWDATVLLYREAIALSLNSDFYQQDLSQRLSQLAEQTAAGDLRDLLFENAVVVAKNSQQARALSPQSRANVARIYAAWASKTEDVQLKERRLSDADFFYSEALKLMPEGVYYWVERARASQNSASRLSSARSYAEQALKLTGLNLQANLVYAQILEQQASVSADISLQETRKTMIAYLERALMIALFTDQAEALNYAELCKAISQLYALLGDKTKEALYAQVVYER